MILIAAEHEGFRLLVRHGDGLHRLNPLALPLSEVVELRDGEGNRFVVACGPVDRMLPGNRSFAVEGEIIAHEHAGTTAPLQADRLVDGTANPNGERNAIDQLTSERERAEELLIVLAHAQLRFRNRIARFLQSVRCVVQNDRVGNGNPSAIGRRARDGFQLFPVHDASPTVQHEIRFGHDTFPFRCGRFP